MHFECDISSIHFPHPREDFAGKFVGTYAVDTSIHFPHPREDLLADRYTANRKTSIHFPHPREDVIPCNSDIIKPTSIHFPHPREDHRKGNGGNQDENFNPLPSSEGRQSYQYVPSESLYFNPLPSSEGRRVGGV